MIDDTVLKEILEKELEKYINSITFDDETEYFSTRNAFIAGFKTACLNVDKLALC